MDYQRRRDIPGDLGIVGVGAIAEAIVTGLSEGEDAAASIHLSPRSAGRANPLAARYRSVHVVDSNQAVVDRAEVVLLCVRPQDAPAALSELAFRAQHAVISVMAGVPIEALRPLVAPAEVLVRAIPLPAVARRAGLTAIHPRHELARDRPTQRGTWQPSSEPCTGRCEVPNRTTSGPWPTTTRPPAGSTNSS
jgi:pyrroline-5-carboxylate reductase